MPRQSGAFRFESTLCIEVSFFQVRILPTTPALFSVGVVLFLRPWAGLDPNFDSVVSCVDGELSRVKQHIAAALLDLDLEQAARR